MATTFKEDVLRDVDLSSGLQIRDETNNQIESLILSNTGEWRAFPNAGAGILQFINSAKNLNVIRQNIINALNAGNFGAVNIAISDDGRIVLNTNNNIKNLNFRDENL